MSATLPPSATRLRELRQQGDWPRSREAVSGAAFAGAALALLVSASATWEALLALARAACQALALPATALQSLRALAEAGGALLVSAALPAVAAAAAAALVAILLQVGWPWALHWPRWQPRSLGLTEAARRGAGAALRLGAIAALFALALAPRSLPTAATAEGLFRALVACATAALWGAMLTLGVLGLGHFAFARWRWLRRARMTPQQARQEQRELESDPQMKARRLRFRKQEAKQRSSRAAAAATLVVLAPGECAAAVRIPAVGSPTLLIAGSKETAARLSAAARRLARPIADKPALARALTALPNGSAVPPELHAELALALTAAQEERSCSPSR